VFEQAGWKVSTQTITGMVLKPGIAMLAAEEVPAPWVDVVHQALEAGGLTVTYGTGYRPYYEEKKLQDPKWVGLPIAPDQRFIIVIGPQPKT
jgi:hypothetical protein